MPAEVFLGEICLVYMEEMSDDEPLEHSVLDAAVTCRRVVTTPVRPPVQCSIMTMGLARGFQTEDGGPSDGPHPELTLSDGPHVTGIVDRISDGPVLLPAVDGGRVAWSSADGRPLMGDGNTDGCITTGFQRWKLDGDIEDQYETFNGMPVYCGGDLYDSEDSDWDYPYALASAAYVEDYNFDVPEGMDLMVHRHIWFPESSDVRQDCQMDVSPVYQTVSFATKDEWNASENDSLTMTADEVDEWNTSDSDSLNMTADENDPDMNDFYQRVVSSDDENYGDSDNGSAADCDGSISKGAYCVGSDDGSAADLDVDILNIDDDSDIRSVTDVNSGSSGVDMEDDYDFNRMSVGNSDLHLYDRRFVPCGHGGFTDFMERVRRWTQYGSYTNCYMGPGYYRFSDYIGVLLLPLFDGFVQDCDVLDSLLEWKDCMDWA